jgi:hypothetical protein
MMKLFALQSRRSWVVFLGLALLSAMAAFKLMVSHIPVLDVDIRFSRAEAVAAAGAFLQQQFPDIKTDRTAVRFVSDRGLQNYVELEGGGVTAFKNLINNPDAVTHYWRVRCFSEGQEKELTTAYSPRGELLSFWLTLPDREPGAALDEAAARTIAEAGMRKLMGERFDRYHPFDMKMKRQTNGRADYTFTYEHSQLQVGEARFRLIARVAGDLLVGVDTDRHIPEAFDQRFEEMRSVNDQISQVANYLMMGLLGLGGLVGGGIWLHRRHQLRWKSGVVPALVVAAGLTLANLCELPMAWLNYNTTVSANNFLLQQIAQSAQVFLVYGVFLTAIYTIAEGLSRMAFADHPRLFDSWRSPVAGSPDLLGRVLGGYGWVGFFLLYAMVFVIFSSKVLGWWQPTDTESDPNILASWRPALGPIFQALQAGTWEECLFRAVPLSLAVIIGRRFNLLRPLVIATLIGQALIFGGAHANYPNMPGYSRLVELFIPALAFGLVYLRFGLLVGMLSHFVYDLVLMSLPIFAGNDPSLFIDKALVILAGLAPLLWVLLARRRRGLTVPLDAQWRNGIPAEPAPAPVVEDRPEPAAKPLVLRIGLWVPLAVISAVIIFLAWSKPPKVDWPLYQLDRAQIAARADEELARRNIPLAGEWHRTILTHTGTDSSAEFVWREAGRAEFQRLMGTYLEVPYWIVSWNKFDGPVEERAEEWQLWFYPDGRLANLVHRLPEARPGPQLTREQAAAKALGWIVEHGWGDANQLQEKSVEETVRPARSDWVLKYIDAAAFNQKGGQALISISLAGDEVTGFSRGIDVPDEWQRRESEANSRKTPFRIASGFALVLLLGLVAAGFFRRHAGHKLNWRLALPWVLTGSLASLALGLLHLEGTLDSFQPTASWNLQLWMSLGGKLLLASGLGLLLLFFAQALHGERSSWGNAKQDFIQGGTWALLFAGLQGLVSLALPSSAAPQAYAGELGSYIPWLASVISGINQLLPALVLLALPLGMARFLISRQRFLWVALTALVWWLAASLASREVVIALCSKGLALLSYWLMVQLIKRRQMGVALAFAAWSLAITQTASAHAVYTGAGWHAAGAVVGVLVTSYWLLAHWRKHALA